MKLLIVDDDIAAINVIKTCVDLGEIGFQEILEAYNGQKAKELILQHRPEVILCDIDMPLCSGLQLLHWLREQDIEAQFLFLTCFDKFEYAQDSIEYGVSAYLTKPLDFDRLRDALSKAASRTRAKAMEEREMQQNLTRANSATSMLCGFLELVSSFDVEKAGLSRHGMEEQLKDLSSDKYFLLAFASESGEELRPLLQKELPRCADPIVSYKKDGDTYCLALVPENGATPLELEACCLRAAGSGENGRPSPVRCVIGGPEAISAFPWVKRRMEKLLRETPGGTVRWLDAWEDPDNATAQEKIVDAARAYIEQNFRRDLTRNELAVHTFVSQNYLSRIFVKMTGMSIREYVNRRRIEEAKVLLEETDRSVSQIGDELGFDSASYFSTVFCKYCGCSPVAWRSKNAQK